MFVHPHISSTFIGFHPIFSPSKTARNRDGNGMFFGPTFNGKEKDYESGFHYYGARYYWSELLTGWLSVDPMMDKYPSISPYAYCVWNPVILVDPDGREKNLAFNINERNNKQRADNRYLQGWARAYTRNRGVIHLFAHGLNTSDGANRGIQTYVKGTEMDVTSPAVLYDFLMSNSTIFNNHNKEGEASQTSILVMHSCKSGQEGGIAQQASEMLDLLVIAPSENVGVSGRSADPQNVKPSDYTERVKEGGTWNIYYKGDFMESFDGNSKPLFDNPQKIIEKYENMYNQSHSEGTAE
ncbi:MAG: hypothetical protein KBT28_05735 [Bacteroidales bacterium]|nr:hypothetical protein [Candidatus Colimorpha merdihippi]